MFVTARFNSIPSLLPLKNKPNGLWVAKVLKEISVQFGNLGFLKCKLSGVLAPTLPPSNLVLSYLWSHLCPLSWRKRAKQTHGILCTSQKEVRDLQLIGTRKQGFPLKGPKAVRPVTWQGFPFCPSTSSLQGYPKLRWGPPKRITSRTHCLQFSFEDYHLPQHLPAKPQSSTLAWAGQWGRCSQRVWPGKRGGGPFPLSTGTAGGSSAGGSLRRGARKSQV